MQLTEEEFRKLGYQAVDMAAEYLGALPARPVFHRMEETERRAIVDMPLPADPLAGDEILGLLAERILPHPMGNGHPRFFGWVNSPPATMAVITEILAAAMNPSCAGGDHAAIYLEHAVLRWLMELVGFPMDTGGGLLVSGGSAATLTALAAARHRALANLGIDVRKQGVGGVRLRLYTSAQGHSSIQKAVELLGIGSDAICLVDVDDEFRISIPALREAIDRDRSDGWHPFAIAASAGSVHNGAIDPMEELAAVARDERLWLHVDGAYGAAALFDPNCRKLFRGIERVDSLSLDPHKWLSVPVECGCVLVSDKALLREAFSLVPAYVRTEPGKGIGNLPWFSEYGFQQTRGFRALKLWVTMMHAGKSGLAQQVARPIALARYLEQQIAASTDLELCSRGKLSIVCFRYAPPDFAGDLDALNKRIMERMQSGGTAFITNTTLRARFVLRACILHYGTTERDIDAMLGAVRVAAATSHR
jgi:aromatic-L-amino-acid decarboxylase